MNLDPSTVRRLGFIKYLYSLGVEQSKAPEPLAAASLLTFHDSVELFLQLASEHLDAGSRQPGFMDYWGLLAAKLPQNQEPAQKESMRRLNKGRVALKHHGTLPSKLDVEAFRSSTTSFFQDNAPLLFGVGFEEISLLDFVQPKEAKDKLKEADRFVEEGDFEAATEAAGLAFEYVVDSYENSKRDRFRRSTFFFGRDLTFNSSFFMGMDRSGRDERKMADFVDKVKESLESMQQAIKVLALGLDYRRYTRFKMHAPDFVRTMDGTYHSRRFRTAHEPEVTVDDAQFCIDFVVEAAIRIRDFDYEISTESEHGS